MTTLTTPTTKTLADNLVAQISAEISQTIPLLPKAFTRVLAKVFAGAHILNWKFAGFNLLQQFIRTASFAETEVNGKTLRPLVEIGRQIGVGDPDPGTRADLQIQITVITQVGQINAGEQLVRTQTGVIYITLSTVLLDAATKNVDVRAVSDQDDNSGFGAIGNLDPGDTLSFANPLDNVASEAVVLAQNVTGADPESEETYRDRVLQRSQARPQGGATADYQAWGLEAAGIIKIFPYTGQPGEVDVYALADEASSGSSDGIPTQAQLDAVEALIEFDMDGLASRRPLGTLVNVLPITRQPFNVEVTGLDGADLPAAQNAIIEAVTEFLEAREPFIVGLSVFPRLDRVTRANTSGIVDEAAASVGASVTAVTLKIGPSTVTSFTLGQGQLAKLGTVTFL